MILRLGVLAAAQCRRRGRPLVLALHGAEAADGERPQRIGGLPLAPVEQAGAHADGKLIHPHAHPFGGEKMPEFMNHNQHAQHQQSGQNFSDQNQDRKSVGRERV